MCISSFILSHFVDCAISICFTCGFSAPCTAVLLFSKRDCVFFTKRRKIFDKISKIPRFYEKSMTFLFSSAAPIASQEGSPRPYCMSAAFSLDTNRAIPSPTPADSPQRNSRHASLNLPTAKSPPAGMCRQRDLLHLLSAQNVLTGQPQQPSAHPRGRCFPTSRPDPRGPYGRRRPACGKWACADRGRG